MFNEGWILTTCDSNGGLDLRDEAFGRVVCQLGLSLIEEPRADEDEGVGDVRNGDAMKDA